MTKLLKIFVFFSLLAALLRAAPSAAAIGPDPAASASSIGPDPTSGQVPSASIGPDPVPSVSAAPDRPVRITVSPLNAEAVLDSAVLRAQVEYLAAPSTGGRATGTKGSQRVIGWIGEHFQSLGLEPLAGTYFHGFRTSAGVFGRNVIGCIKGTSEPERFIVVMAHFDNLGTLNGTFYPGADSNASGVAALLGLARMFAEMRDCGKTYGRSLLFVALDAKEQGMAGADALYSLLSRRGMQADLIVNLDQLGSSLSPLHKDRPDYLIMLCDSAPGSGSSAGDSSVPSSSASSGRSASSSSASSVSAPSGRSTSSSSASSASTPSGRSTSSSSASSASTPSGRSAAAASAGRTSAGSYRLTLERANIAPGLELDLGFDYYGSRDFTRLFYRNISDQRVFLEHGIPAVMFTSGITLNNNKPHDTPDSLDYSLLTRRVRLIFHFLHRSL